MVFLRWRFLILRHTFAFLNHEKTLYVHLLLLLDRQILFQCIFFFIKSCQSRMVNEDTGLQDYWSYNDEPSGR